MGDLPVLTYFDMEGLGECVRLALVYNDIEFEDRRIKVSDWSPELKATFPFGQLPVLQVDGHMLSQSLSILMWAGRHGSGKAFPQDEDTRLRIEQAIYYTEDFDRAWSPPRYFSLVASRWYGHPEGFAKTSDGEATLKQLRARFLAERLPEFMATYSRLIEESGGFLCTHDEPSIADFRLLPKLRSLMLDGLKFVPADCLAAFPVISAYVERLMAIPKLRAWYEQHPDPNN
mmetsp:Transcript_9538/g.27006  ORF Transcript_9538/g.27006 Transcript_9538/m.27006 type:complete len:231 (-) Transcript_9538:244-936(-)